jgi:hypothetical protein
VSLNAEDSVHVRSDNFLPELVSQRLMQGFQLIIDAEDGEKSVSQTATLVIGSQIHRLQYDPMAENIEVKRFVRKVDYDTTSVMYSCMMWGRSCAGFTQRNVKFNYPQSIFYNWNYLDHLVSGYQDELTESLRFWRSRFILIPMDTLPANMHSYLNPQNETLTDEELRLAGFLKFMELFSRARWLPFHERSARNPKKNAMTTATIPITFTTFNTSTYVANEIFKWKLESSGTRPSPTQLTPVSSALTKDSKLSAVSAAMQHPIDGVQFKDRRWHLRFYERVFIGHEGVDWIIRSFSDISTREDAQEFGQKLLQQGLFEHVNGRHPFLDGHYFYRMHHSYIMDKEEARGSLMMKWFRLRGSSQQQAVKEDLMTLVSPIQPKQIIDLSLPVKIDVDLARKSNREEWAVLHYDTVHNPSNCYHFQIHWLACTSRLVDDMLQSWSRTAEKCGLRMIEAPVEQARLDDEADHPFSSPVPILLVTPPPKIDREKLSYRNIQIPDCYFEIELIKHFGFRLDVEADDKFPEDCIRYSFNRSRYQHTQYVHQTGVAFVQLLPGRGFLWVHNRLIGKSSDACRESFESLCTHTQELNRFWMDTANKLMTEKGLESFLDDIIDDVAQSDQQLKLVYLEDPSTALPSGSSVVTNDDPVIRRSRAVSYASNTPESDQEGRTRSQSAN